MVDKKIEQRIQTAVRNATPDVLDKIYASCEEQKGTVINMSNPELFIVTYTTVPGTA